MKAEPLKPPAPQRKLSDLLRETQDDDDIAIKGPDDLSKDDSLRIGEKANRCCVPQFARALAAMGVGSTSEVETTVDGNGLG